MPQPRSCPLSPSPSPSPRPLPGIPAPADLLPSNPLFGAIGDRAAGALPGAGIPSARHAQLTELAATPEACITAKSVNNAASPMFGSCFDWHCDVHAHWSLYAVSGHTGDPRWAKAATDDLKLDRLDAELRYLNGNNVAGSQTKNPYGLAWTLRLVREREAVTGHTALRPLADAAVGHLKRRMEGWTADVWRRNINDSEYRNPSWALLNMSEWAAHVGDADLAEWVRANTRTHLKDSALDETLPATRDATAERGGGAFAPALLRLAAVGAIEGEESRDWVAQRVPADLHVVAFPNVGTSHANAQTFARAMALNMLGAQLGRADLRANADELIDWQMVRPEVWKWGNDFLNTHWIAQMGILAITAPAGPGAQVVAPSDPVGPTGPTGPTGPEVPSDPADPGVPGLPGVPRPTSSSM